MNRKIGIYAAIINLLAVVSFSITMFANSSFGSYLTSFFIAFSFVVMICTFAHYSKESSKVAGLSAIIFGGMYALCNSIVYFIQLTTVRNSTLNEQAVSLLDFKQFGLMFNLDMLGYCLMALSTFFIGFTVDVKTRADKWLKWLLIIHGVFAISTFIVPFLGLFDTTVKGSNASGNFVLQFWCIYFAPISALSILHFLKKS